MACNQIVGIRVHMCAASECALGFMSTNSIMSPISTMKLWILSDSVAQWLASWLATQKVIVRSLAPALRVLAAYAHLLG